MTYKLIEECALDLKRFSCMASGKVVDCVQASDLEAFLAKGVRVYGGSETSVNKEFLAGDSHSGILINYKSIPKLEPVSKEEIIKFVQENTHKFNSEAAGLIERLKSAGVKP